MGCLVSSIILDYQQLNTRLHKSVAGQYAELKTQIERISKQEAAEALKEVQKTNWPDTEGYQMVKAMLNMQTRANGHCFRWFVDRVTMDVATNEKMRRSLRNKRDEVITFLQKLSGDDDGARQEAMRKRPMISLSDATFPMILAPGETSSTADSSNVNVITDFLQDNPQVLTKVMAFLTPPTELNPEPSLRQTC